MKKSELLIWGLFISFFILISWQDHPFLSIVFGSNGIIPFLQRVFETKYCHRNIFLSVSIVILVSGWIIAFLYLFRWGYEQNVEIGIFLAAFLSLFTFLISFSSTKNWNN